MSGRALAQSGVTKVVSVRGRYSSGFVPSSRHSPRPRCSSNLLSSFAGLSLKNKVSDGRATVAQAVTFQLQEPVAGSCLPPLFQQQCIKTVVHFLNIEGGEYVGESGKTYLAVSALGQANVWTAVEKTNMENLVVLKSPAVDDTEPGWPQFQHEMVVHELLKDCDSIRKQVDRIPPVGGAGTPPMLVLEILETTLWSARTKRPFTKEEVRAVARQVMRGLKDVHDKGLVYADLKMQNVMINGFDADKPGDLSKLTAKLGDLGIVMYPQKGTVQPVAYRAPEVFFRGAITQAADIWGFGLIYCHLMEAIERFEKTGLYDDLYTGSGSMREREQAMRYALANDYDLENKDYYKDCALPYRASDHEEGNHWEELQKRGLDKEDIEFLQWILKSDPRRRPSAQAVLDSDVLNPGLNGEMEAGQSPGELEGMSEHAREAAANHDPVKRRRRDADSAGPAEMATVHRPETLMRGASQVVFTPGITPGIGLSEDASGGYMMHKPRNHVSPILEHPLMKSVIEESNNESQDDTRSHLADAEGGAEEDGSETAARPAEASNDTSETPSGVVEASNGIAEASSGDPEAASSTTEAPRHSSFGTNLTTEVAQPQRPAGLAHIGKTSSSGGTWLSYQ
ncbi:hypothetical protein LTR17_001872 [Elasticomyces elasticus]|nr:hypothetical protein LTR17_001872 [Elasticomyces elasticus]